MKLEEQEWGIGMEIEEYRNETAVENRGEQELKIEEYRNEKRIRMKLEENRNENRGVQERKERSIGMKDKNRNETRGMRRLTILHLM